MNPETLLHGCLWFISALWFVEHAVSMTRKRAPRRNRMLPPPSIHCERSGKFEVSMHDTVFAARQAD
jgi:hypothetical protein